MKSILTALAILIAAPVAADDLIGQYVAYIGDDDLYNAGGERLSQPWQVLRQDRANYHRFGVSQPGDEWDSFFGEIDNREAMEQIVTAGVTTPQAASEIVNGGSMVVVHIFGTDNVVSSVDVDVSN